MPWNGYNFEDSILISDAWWPMTATPRFTSKNWQVVARDTKLGPEEITRDIPNVEANARPSGRIRRGVHRRRSGSRRRAGGQGHAEGRNPADPEEKLLRAIFGEKASDVKDTSLRIPTGMQGTVIDVQVFTREGIERDKRAQSIIDEELKRYRLDLNDQMRIFEADAFSRIERLIAGKVANGGPEASGQGREISKEYLDSLPSKHDWFDIRMADEDIAKQLELMKESLIQKREEFDLKFDDKKRKLTPGRRTELPPGVQKMVKVYIAVKRRLQPGDKMAGRHGNKGVVSKILPVEDMPFMADGTPVDIVLNPLGVPSRMNVGQILEVHLGWAARSGQAV